MSSSNRPIRVLYSFPHKLGASRVSYAAWQHVQGLINAGADMTVFPGVLHRPLAGKVRVQPTLSRGRFRIPYKVLGRKGACVLHDWIVARRMESMRSQIDLVHAFPLGALRTLRNARRLGIPTVLERCNAHTEYAYGAVQRECAKLGITMPPGHEHDYNEDYLNHEKLEYAEAHTLFCPSDFVARTFAERGFPSHKLARFQYGFDEKACFPLQNRERKPGLTVLFAAGCAPRKGLHYALEAWLLSSAHKTGTLLVAGEFIPGYAEKLDALLSHPSVKRIGFRKDLPDVMRSADIMVLPSIEEGSALVTYDARGNGCVILVSDASGAVCTHMENALVHPVGDVKTLAEHFTRLDHDRQLLEALRRNSLATAHELTWASAGRRMLEAYRTILDNARANPLRQGEPQIVPSTLL